METRANSHLPISQPGSVILDNATLRNALIVLGIFQRPIANDKRSIKIVDSQVACAEILIESILLHEHIYAPKIHAEDYLEPATFLQWPDVDVVREIEFTPSNMQSIMQSAEQDFAVWPQADDKLRKRLREFSGVEAPITYWDRWIHSQYSAASGFRQWTGYLHEIADYHVSRLDTTSVEDIKDVRHAFVNRSPRYESERIEAAILWLTYRTCVYDWIAFHVGMAYVPHPQRSALWKAINVRRSQPKIFNELPYDVLFDTRIMVGTRLNTRLYDLSIPPFFTYVLSKSKSVSDILQVAFELRNKRGVRELRTKLNEISENLKGSVLRMQRLKRDFDKLKNELTIEYYVDSAPQITPSIQIAGTVGIEANIKLPVPVVKLAAELWSLNKPHLAFLRDVYKTTVDIWKFSNVYDRLFSHHAVLLERSVTTPHITKSPPDSAIPDASGGWDYTVDIEDPDYEPAVGARRKLEDFLLSGNDVEAFISIIDIDNMDSVWNMHGKVIGDIIIHKVALAIKKLGVDSLSRVAGDTFIVIKFKGSLELERKIREAVRAIPTYVRNSDKEIYGLLSGKNGDWDLSERYGKKYQLIFLLDQQYRPMMVCQRMCSSKLRFVD